MSDKYGFLACDRHGCIGFYHNPVWDNDCWLSTEGDCVLDGPQWLKPGQLYERESYPISGNRFDGSNWKLIEDHGSVDRGEAVEPEYRYNGHIVSKSLYKHLTRDKSKDRGSALSEAINIINGERQNQYGSPEDSFALIAEYWNTYLASIHGQDIDAKHVAMMMVLFKIARERNQHKRDNLVDAAGYLGILADMS